MAGLFPVVLHVYDISNGHAARLSPVLLGEYIEAVYHTGVVVYNREYFFGGGIQSLPPGETPFGRPMERIELSATALPPEVFDEFLSELAQSGRFSASTYSLLSNNCNHFRCVDGTAHEGMETTSCKPQRPTFLEPISLHPVTSCSPS